MEHNFVHRALVAARSVTQDAAYGNYTSTYGTPVETPCHAYREKKSRKMGQRSDNSNDTGTGYEGDSIIILVPADFPVLVGDKVTSVTFLGVEMLHLPVFVDTISPEGTSYSVEALRLTASTLKVQP